MFLSAILRVYSLYLFQEFCNNEEVTTLKQLSHNAPLTGVISDTYTMAYCSHWEYVDYSRNEQGSSYILSS